MVDIAVCGNSEADAVRALLDAAVSTGAAVRRFENGRTLMDSISTGKSFDVFLLDRSELNKLLDARQNDKMFLLRTQKGDRAIPLSDIIAVESYCRALAFHIEDSEPLYSKTIRTRFDEALAPLLADGRFLHARKSCLFNIAKVSCVKNHTFVMKNGMELHVPRHCFAETKAQYLAYLTSIHAI